MLAVAVAGKGCSDDAVARTASMPVELVRSVIPSMLERCQHVPALLVAKANRTPAGTIFSGIRLSEEAERCLRHLQDMIRAWPNIRNSEYVNV